ncbi:MAG: hypothetical protein V3T72_01905, partial [Thermoanaerobaculia bacterium]
FSPRLEEIFRLEIPDGGSMELRLVEAVAVGGTAADRDPFSVVFEGEKEPILAQATYRLHHDGMGTLELFLVPLGPIGDGVRYESVFT